MSTLKKSMLHHLVFFKDDSLHRIVVDIPAALLSHQRGWLMCFCVCSLYPSVPSALKQRGNERFNERNGAIDPPFILMGEQITVNYRSSHLVV